MRDPRQLSPALLLVAQRSDAADELRHRLEQQPQAVAQGLIGKGLATYALARLPEMDIDPAPIQASLAQAALIELGWTAKRKLALAEVNRLAADGRPRMVFKGAATSILLYPQETWRWSGDIDVMMHEDDLTELHPAAMAKLRAKQQEIPFPEHHIERQIVMGTAVELHYRLEFAPAWGALSDLLPNARPCPGLPNLLAPAADTACTLALLHLLKHRGSMPFDFLDLALIEESGLNWTQLAENWRDAGIAAYTIAGLAAAHELAGIGPADVVETLWNGLRGSDATCARFLRQCVLADALPRLRGYRFECLLMGIPFGRFCLRTFLGTRAATQRLTGYAPRDPRFWLAHCLALPCRRLWRLGTQGRRQQ